MTRYRRFLAGLRFDPTNELGKLSDNTLFSETELKSESIKWLKRLLLARTGLSNYKTLLSEIHRFSDNQLDLARRTCLALAKNGLRLKRDFLIVSKIIPYNSLGQIPNYRIYTPADVSPVFEILKTKLVRGAQQELWFCLSDIGKNTFSLGGRILVGKLDAVSVVELVWYTSPRMLEEINIQHSRFPFWRGKRALAQIRYRTSEFVVPTNMESKRQQLMDEVQMVLANIHQRQDAIDHFSSMLFSSGVNTVIMEFRINSGDFAFIDWDTDIDN
jgi:hypothetical protein